MKINVKAIITAIILIFASAVIFSACSWTSGGNTELIFPEKNVSYLLHVKPFFQQNCSYSPCHNSPSDPQSGGYVILEYHNVIAIPGFIVAGNPDGSRLMQILDNKTPHFTNFYRGNITDNQIKGIRQWLKEGAVNN
ncbi:MAG: hypothetical protein LBO69_00650 [Ignavibacteria bacterium]|jgi:hypothetical protein|nr:hypothetical protein [Ignavibacteria bacterium]